MPLRARQLQVCMLRAEGLSAREVGRRLNISHRTVEVHVQRAYATLNVNNVVQMTLILLKLQSSSDNN